MSSTLRFSIITPSFNQGRFLEATLRSVLEQGYPNVEYMVLDGGSTDESVEILHRFSNRLSYWVSERDGGQTDAINKGFARATGDVFMWLNSDDLLLPGTLRRVADGFSEAPEAGVIHGDAWVIDETGAQTGVVRSARFLLGRLIVGKGPHMVQPASFLRRERIRPFFPLDASLRYAMDFQMWLRSGDRIGYHYVPASLAAFRNHSGTKRAEIGVGYPVEGKRVMDEFFARTDLSERIRCLRADAYATNIEAFLLWNLHSGREALVQDYFERAWGRGLVAPEVWVRSAGIFSKDLPHRALSDDRIEALLTIYRALAVRYGDDRVHADRWCRNRAGALLLTVASRAMGTREWDFSGWAMAKATQLNRAGQLTPLALRTRLKSLLGPRVVEWVKSAWGSSRPQG